jgi:hypothetical protein
MLRVTFCTFAGRFGRARVRPMIPVNPGVKAKVLIRHHLPCAAIVCQALPEKKIRREPPFFKTAGEEKRLS